MYWEPVMVTADSRPLLERSSGAGHLFAGRWTRWMALVTPHYFPVNWGDRPAICRRSGEPRCVSSWTIRVGRG